MTLWYLLSRVDQNDRGRVYARMVELVPPPDGVTRDGVLRLDQEMLKRWRDRIDSDSHSLPEVMRDFWERFAAASGVISTRRPGNRDRQADG